MIGQDWQPPYIDSVTTANGTQLNSTQKIITKFESFYSDLYSPKCSHTEGDILKHCVKLPARTIRSLLAPPNPIKIAATLDNVNKGGTPRLDGIPYKLYTQCLHAIAALLRLFTHVWNTGKVPESWCQSLVRLIPKQGQPSQWVKNYQPIALTGCDAKLLSNIINSKIQPTLISLIPNPLCHHNDEKEPRTDRCAFGFQKSIQLHVTSVAENCPHQHQPLNEHHQHYHGN